MSNKIAILGDTHFGVRGDSLDFLRYYEKFYDNVFFPELTSRGIDKVIQLGDLFDRRKFVNFNSLYHSRKMFFDKLKKYEITLYTLLGNHDVSFKNTLEVNSPLLLLDGYDNIKIFRDFERIGIASGIPIDVIPWICEENEKEILDKIKNSRSQICVGHFELDGFEMDRGNVFRGGHLSKKDLAKYDMVLSGHFHHKSDDGHVYYVGTPYELTWSDWNDERGFHIFDVEKRELEFIKNPYQMFHKITYDDTVNDMSFWKSYDYESKKDTYIKIVILNKKDPYLFDFVVDNFYKAGVCDIGIVEDFTEKDVVKEDDVDVDQAEDNLSIITKFIDQQNINVDPDKLKSIMREIYIEALNMEKTE